MTNRERMLAVLNGGEPDRVPFVQYDRLAGPNTETWAEIGRDNLGLLRWCSAHRFENPNCRFETEDFARNGLRGVRRTLVTPAGQLTQERLIEPALNSAATAKHFVKDPGDYRVLAAYLRDITVVEDLTALETAIAELGEDGLPHLSVPRTPYQQLWVEWVSIADLSLHLADDVDGLAECIAVMSDLERRVMRVVRQASAKVRPSHVVVPDNITAPAIGPAKFRQFCVPFYNELAELLADINVHVAVHADGDLEPLWSDIGKSRVWALDSMSPPPDNDTPVAAALRMWPEKRILINFPSSCHLESAENIYQRALVLLEEGGHSRRFWIQISENMPPGRWRTSYPAIVRAVREFGRP